ncbi:MAG: hypothetical protein ABSD47_20110 [Candidatus Methylomirabilota bacterium]
MLGLGGDVLMFLGTALRSQVALAAENRFLRKQVVLYRERPVKPRRASDAMRLALVLLARCFAWREALTLVQLATLTRWHRQAFRLLWRWRSSPSGRPRLPADLQRLIAAMARSTPTWGEERIAAELLSSSSVSASRRAPCVGTWPAGGAEEGLGPPGNAGPPSSGTTLTPCWPATAAWR